MKIFTPAHPVQGFLQESYCQMAAWTARLFSLSFPAQWAAFNDPVDIFIIPVQANLLVGEIIEKRCKCLTSRFKFGR
jgi:hypothetical protein